MAHRDEKATARTAGMVHFYVLLGVIALVGVGAVAYGVLRPRQAALVPLDLEGLDDPETLVAMARGVARGDSTASVTIIEFGDYQCPGCGQFARDYEPGIRTALIETGRARFVFYDYPLVAIHPHAFLAARAARCAEDQGMFWEYHDELYRQQAIWSMESAPAGTFEGYAQTLGLDASDFRACLNSERHADLVTANMRLAEELGIPRTPTVLVNVPGGGTAEAAGWSAEEIAATIDSLSVPATN